jgi:hypothetical protein
MIWLGSLVAGLSARKAGYDPGSVYLGFVVDRMALGQVFFPLGLRSPVSVFIPPLLHYKEKQGKELIIFIPGLHNKPHGCGVSVAYAAGPFTTKNLKLEKVKK